MQQPQIFANASQYNSLASYNGQYLLLMVDPDAGTPQNPNSRFLLHWMAQNVQVGQIPNIPAGFSQATNGLRTMIVTQSYVPYLPPAPGTDSSAHRYLIYAFQQPQGFQIPSQFSNLAGGQNRQNFDLNGFISSANLNRPAAANYFYVSRQNQVPGTFVAVAGGVYPGGNGNAIFDGYNNGNNNGNGNGNNNGNNGNNGNGNGNNNGNNGNGNGNNNGNNGNNGNGNGTNNGGNNGNGNGNNGNNGNGNDNNGNGNGNNGNNGNGNGNNGNGNGNNGNGNRPFNNAAASLELRGVGWMVLVGSTVAALL